MESLILLTLYFSVLGLLCYVASKLGEANDKAAAELVEDFSSKFIADLEERRKANSGPSWATSLQKRKTDSSDKA